MTSTNSKLLKTALPLVVILTILLFVEYPQDYDNLVFKSLWETGHFALFAGLVFTFIHIPKIRQLRFIQLVIGTAVFSLVVGLLTETLQLFIGRSFAIEDILKDFIGGYAGLFLTQISRIKPFKVNLVFSLGFIGLTALATHTLIIASINEWYIHRDFPTIANFENAFEVDRWSSRRASISLSTEITRQGKYSLKLNYPAVRTPRVFIKQFIKDWRAYRNLVFSIYNETEKPIFITLKVYDKAHRNSGYKYTDRYNLKTELKPGWNDYSLPLKQIKQAPGTREMDMQEIESFGIWIPDLKQPVSIYLDDVRLER